MGELQRVQQNLISRVSRYLFCACCIATASVTLQWQYAYASTTHSADHATVTVAALGDIMLGTNYPYDRLPENDGNYLLADVTSSLLQADIIIANLEGVMLSLIHI